MTKHIYVHSSNLEYTIHIREMENFYTPEFYSIDEVANLKKNEYGLIRVDNTAIHLIIGKNLQDKCPWCGTIPCIKKVIVQNVLFDREIQYTMECPNCYSRGPLSAIILTVEVNEDIIMYIEDLVYQKYRQVKQWDEDLKD